MNVLHHGEIGDIIYSLCAVKAMGGCDTYYLRPAPRSFVRERMEGARVELIRGLLALQPYVGRVSTAEPPSDVVALDSFRRHFTPTRNLADCHLESLGLPLHHRDTQWLYYDRPNRVADVVFARSPRFQNQFFPWKRVWEKYRESAVFVGLPEEHAVFCRDVGDVRYYRTANFIELTRAIAGCKLFVGNSSSPLAVAEAMKMSLVEEVCARSPTTLFLRPGAIMGYDGSVRLPDVPRDMDASFRPEWRDETLEHESVEQTISRLIPPREDYVPDRVLMRAVKAMGLPPDANVLDFGAGMLRNSIGMSELGLRVTAYDTLMMLEKGQAYWRDRTSGICTSFDWLGLRRQRFDAVVAAMCFQHIPPAHLRSYLQDLKPMTQRLLVWGRTMYDDYQTNVWDTIASSGWKKVREYDSESDATLSDPETHRVIEFFTENT